MFAAIVTTVLYAAASALVPALPAEPYLVGLVAATDQPPVPLGIAAGVGQSAGKVVIFLAVRGTIRSPWLRRRLNRLVRLRTGSTAGDPTTPTERSTAERSTAEPSTTEPSTPQRAATAPPATEPATADPATTEPSTADPATTDPATTEPTATAGQTTTGTATTGTAVTGTATTANGAIASTGTAATEPAAVTGIAITAAAAAAATAVTATTGTVTTGPGATIGAHAATLTAVPRPAGTRRTATAGRALARRIPTPLRRLGSAAGRLTRAASQWLTRALDRPVVAALTVFVSAVIGIPPLVATTVYASVTRMSVVLFGTVCLIGRSIRFVALALVPTLLM